MIFVDSVYGAETCLSDVKRMEPIDGLNRINKVYLFVTIFFIARAMQ